MTLGIKLNTMLCIKPSSVGQESFKIPQGAVLHHRKKLEAAEHLTIKASVLKRDLDPSENLLMK